MDEQDMTFIKTKLPAFMENERERVRREKEEKLEKIRKLKEGDPKDMTVFLLREVLLEMGVNFKASDSKKKLVERVLTERSKANRANNASREHTTDAELIQDQTSTSSDSSSTSLATLKYSTYFASVPDIPKPAVEPNTNARVVRRNNTYFVYFIDYDAKKKILLLALVLFLLHLMNCCDIESLAYIACVLQQLLQTPLAVLIEIYFEVMRTLLALLLTILFTLYTVACVQIQNKIELIASIEFDWVR